MPDFTRLDDVRARRPLIHCVSNIVSANDCANLVLAAGASPIMAHAPQEVADVTAASDATVLNTGTPDEARFETCRLCGQEAARLGRPVVLDPVSAALLASAFWKACARQAEERAGGRGPGSFRMALLDAAGTLTAADLAAEAEIERE